MAALASRKLALALGVTRTITWDCGSTFLVSTVTKVLLVMGRATSGPKAPKPARGSKETAPPPIDVMRTSGAPVGGK